MEIESYPPLLADPTHSAPHSAFIHVPKNCSTRQSEIIGKMSSLSFVDTSKGQSVFVTSLVICNNMIGSIVMILPMVFAHCGIFTSLFVMILLSLVNFITCNMYVVHLKRTESDLPEMIERILGVRWKVIFVFSAVLFEFLTGIVFLIIMNNMLYPSITFILSQFGFENYAKKADCRYDIFSFQINAWLLCVPCYLSCFVKQINIFATLSKIGTYVLCFYVIFLFYTFFENYSSGNVPENLENIQYFTSNITEVSGTFCMAFFVHLVIAPLVKPMKKPEETTKALAIGYSLSSIFYLLVGVIGFLAILGRNPTDDHPQTIMDYFEKDSFSPVLIELLYFIKLGSTYPIFCFLSKSQLLSIFNQKEEEDEQNDKNWKFSMAYNTLYMGLGMICVLNNINLTFAIGFSAAVFGFLFVYLIPIYLHLKCYKDETDELKCNAHNDRFKYSSFVRGSFYICLLIPIGIYLMVIQFVALFDFNWV